jgi:hypothetical protein
MAWIVDVSPARAAIAGALAVAAIVALRVGRHVEEARVMIAPATRAVLHEVEDGHIADAASAAQMLSYNESQP